MLGRLNKLLLRNGLTKSFYPSIQTQRFSFASQKQTNMENSMQKKFIGQLIRGQQGGYQLRLGLLRHPVDFRSDMTVQDLHGALAGSLGMEENQFQIFADDQSQLAPDTPIEVLLEHTFYLRLDSGLIRIEGEQFVPTTLTQDFQDSQVQQNLINLELPLLKRRSVEEYFSRLDLWLQAKMGVGYFKNNTPITLPDASSLLVQAMVDFNPKARNLLKMEEQWREEALRLGVLKKKRDQAYELCARMVRNRLFIGAGLLSANIGFIWSGTYVFFSWDIIEPMAYFISSMGSIALMTQFFKIGKPFTMDNYRKYLLDKYAPIAFEKVGFDETEFKNKELAVKIIEADLRDELMKKL